MEHQDALKLEIQVAEDISSILQVLYKTK